MNSIKEMRQNLGQPGALPKTIDKHPMHHAITVRRKQKAMKSRQLDQNGQVSVKPTDTNLGYGDFSE